MLISEVLRILDTQEQPVRESVAQAGGAFAALLSAQGRADGAPVVPEQPRGGLTAAIGNAVSARNAAEQFPLGQHSYDTFLRALKDAKKPRALHRLDLFQ